MARPPLALELICSNRDGSESTVFPDSAKRPADTQAIIASLTHKFNTGFESMAAVLHRDPRRSYPAPRIMQHAVVKGATGIVWEGRVTDVPTNRGGRLQADGYWSALKSGEYGSVNEVYVDSDTNSWGQTPLGRRAYLSSNALDIASIRWERDLGLSCPLPNQALGTGVFATGAYYIAPPGAKIGEVAYQISTVSYPAGWRAPHLEYDDQYTTAHANGNTLTADGAERATTLTPPARYVELNVYSNGTASTPVLGANVKVTSLVAFGDQDLREANDPYGVYASEVIKHVIGKYAPMISADSQTIASTNYPIRQLVVAGGSVEDVILRANAYHLFELAVREGPTLWFQPQRDLDDYDYELSLYRGDTRDVTGTIVGDDEPLNGVWVHYPDVTLGGEPARVGPYGSGAGYDSSGDASLLVTDPENPCNRAGDDRFPPLTIGWPVTRADAILLGSAWLAEKQVATSAGTAQATGYVKNRAGVEVPAYMIRDGDRVKFTDEQVVRRVYGAAYDPQSFTVSLSFERPGMSYEGLVERLALGMAGAAAGSGSGAD